MSEQHIAKHEHGGEQPLNPHEAKARQKELLDEARKEAAESKHHHQEKLDEIRREIEKNAETANEARAHETKHNDEPEAANTYWNSQEYRDIAFKQLMHKVQKHLSKPEKTVSKILHQPTVERLSEVGSKTVARPSGVLVGSIFSFISSLIVYFISKQYAYDMTYSVFVVSFLGGFMFGIVAEFGYRTIRGVLSRN